MRRDQRPGERGGAVEPGCDVRGVVHAAAHERAATVAELGAHGEPPPVELAVCRSPSVTSGQLDPALERLVALAARRQEAQRRGQRRAGPGSATHSSRAWSNAPAHSAAYARRIDDPERRRRRVLRRARRVGVQRVALVQQRGDELIEHRRPQQLLDACVEARQPPRRAAGVQRRERLVAQPDPAAAGVVLGDHRPPGRDRQPKLRGRAPWHRHDLQPPVRAAVEDGAAEVEAERDLAVGERVEVLRGGDLEVVGAGHLERERGRAGEGGHDRGHARPGEPLRRRRPARRQARTAPPGARASARHSRAWRGRS